MPATFNCKDIAKSLGIERRRLAHYFERGLVPVPHPGSGAHREFTHADVVRIAVLDRLVALGIGAARAAGLAGEYAHARGLLVIRPSGAAEVMSLTETGATIPSSAVIIDLNQLRRDVDSRLPIAA
jgi:hypothetical protein